MELLKDTKIDFLKYKIPAMLFSLVIIVAGLLMIWKNGLRYGVDFSGGMAIHLKFRQAQQLDAIRDQMKQAGYHDSGVQGFKDPSQVLIRLPQAVSSEQETERLTRQVSETLSANLLKASIPEGKKDLNSATPSDITGYLQIKDPWKVGDPKK